MFTLHRLRLGSLLSISVQDRNPSPSPYQSVSDNVNEPNYKHRGLISTQTLHKPAKINVPKYFKDILLCNISPFLSLFGRSRLSCGKINWVKRPINDHYIFFSFSQSPRFFGLNVFGMMVYSMFRDIFGIFVEF